MSEAMRIAKKQLGELLKKNGKKVGDYEASAINDAAKKLIDKSPEIMDLAKQRVQEQQALASADLGDLLSGLTEKSTSTDDPRRRSGVSLAGGFDQYLIRGPWLPIRRCRAM
jgi:hypothetical protein